MAPSDILVVDLIKAMTTDADQEEDPAKRRKLRADVRSLQRVWFRSKYALAPTRDAMTAAIGNASLNISERLDEVLRLVRTTSEEVSSVFQSVQEMASQLEKLEQRLNDLDARDARQFEVFTQTREREAHEPRIINLEKAVKRLQEESDGRPRENDPNPPEGPGTSQSTHTESDKESGIDCE